MLTLFWALRVEIFPAVKKVNKIPDSAIFFKKILLEGFEKSSKILLIVADIVVFLKSVNNYASFRFFNSIITEVCGAGESAPGNTVGRSGDDDKFRS